MDERKMRGELHYRKIGVPGIPGRQKNGRKADWGKRAGDEELRTLIKIQRVLRLEI
jgi:hypothetical protein